MLAISAHLIRYLASPDMLLKQQLLPHLSHVIRPRLLPEARVVSEAEHLFGSIVLASDGFVSDLLFKVVLHAWC